MLLDRSSVLVKVLLHGRRCRVVGVAVRSCFEVFEVVCFKGSYSMVLLREKGSSVQTWTRGRRWKGLASIVSEVVCNRIVRTGTMMRRATVRCTCVVRLGQ